MLFRISSLLCRSPEGDGGGSGGTADENKDEKPNTVARDAYDRVLGETKAEREKRKAAEAELAEYKRKEKEAAEAEALKRGEFDKLMAAKDAEVAAEREKAAKEAARAASLLEAQVENKKYGAFLRNLGASLDPKWINLVDLDQIKADENGVIDEASATKYANDFKTHYPQTIATTGNPNFPDKKPGGNATVTWDSEKTTRANLKERKALMAEEYAKEKAKLGWK